MMSEQGAVSASSSSSSSETDRRSQESCTGKRSSRGKAASPRPLKSISNSAASVLPLLYDTEKAPLLSFLVRGTSCLEQILPNKALINRY